jgi:hypothetical protein
MCFEVLIALKKVPVDCEHRGVGRFVIAVMDDGSCHATEDGFDYVQKLGARWQRCQLQKRAMGRLRSSIVFIDKGRCRRQLFREMP